MLSRPDYLPDEATAMRAEASHPGWEGRALYMNFVGWASSFFIKKAKFAIPDNENYMPFCFNLLLSSI